MSQTFMNRNQNTAPESIVYILRFAHEGYSIAVHIAVRRDDLRTFVVFATLPNEPTGVCTPVQRRALILRETFATAIANWKTERVCFGETDWLIRRHDPSWRFIRRFGVAADGTATVLGCYPLVVADPLLFMLEGSVPSPNMPLQGTDSRF